MTLKRNKAHSYMSETFISLLRLLTLNLGLAPTNPQTMHCSGKMHKSSSVHMARLN